MTATSALSIAKPSGLNSSPARSDLRKGRAESDPTRQFRLPTEQEPREAAALDDAQAQKSSNTEPMAHAPDRDRQSRKAGDPAAIDREPEEKPLDEAQAATGPIKGATDEPVDTDKAQDAPSDAQIEPSEAQDARGETQSGRGTDAQETADSAENPRTASEGKTEDAARAKSGREQLAASRAGEQSAKLDGPTLKQPTAAHTNIAGSLTSPSRPLTIRELNDALSSIDRRMLPTGLLADLGLEPQSSVTTASTDDASDSQGESGRTPDDAGFQTARRGSERAQQHTEHARDDSSTLPGSTVRPSADSKTSARSESTGTVSTSAAPIEQQSSAHTTTPTRADSVAVINGQTNHAPRSIFKLGAADQAAPGHRDAPDAKSLQAQVARGLASAVTQKGGNITMRLQPDALGALRIELDLKDAVVAVRFHASTDAARSLIHAALPALRATLEGQGLRVSDMAVRVATDAGSAKPAEPAPQQGSHAQNHAGWSESSRPDSGAANPDGRRHQDSQDSPGRSLGRTQTAGLESEDIADEAMTDDWRPAEVLDHVTLRLDAVA